MISYKNFYIQFFCKYGILTVNLQDRNKTMCYEYGKG